MSPFRRANGYLLVVYFVCITAGSQWVWRYNYQSLLEQHQAQLDRFSSHISAKLDKYAHLPKLLAKDTELISALQHSANVAQLTLTNQYLGNVNRIIQASDTYLLDKWGNTIAASNWQSEVSFVGKNFAWRPYYSEAIQGRASQYFALGSTSGQRGYYYSYPVTYATEVIGVIVIKMDLSAIEENWKSKQDTLVATDQYDVIFMSSHPQWLFKSLTSLSAIERKTITDSRQYLNTEIQSLGLEGDLLTKHSELKNPSNGWIQGDYLVSSRTLPTLDLTIRVLSEKIALFWATLSFSLVLTMLFVIAFLMIQLFHQRYLKKLQLEHIQSEATQKLEFLVMERTAELQAEVSERRRTEQALRQTQDELVQAAKLAVLGQMSASISHELNNPLAAVRSFADNGRRYLENNKLDRVDENLSRISALTDRMAKISRQLKAFARKSETRNKTVLDLEPILISAKDLVAPQIKSFGVQLVYRCTHTVGAVNINAIQIEQVLINLITNAAQAVEAQSNKYVSLTTEQSGDAVLIYIDDNGSGIPDDQLSHIFEPFFTTKTNGLGLGLSISQQIIQAMEGELSVSTSPFGGARFIISLPNALTSD
ncbi:ATP-binding protein [Vibrio ostreicida]|uniref:histidine kinase n=1 Tax=Vibrio ostreicida TaxID=526588 RepID=A0ABT8BV77_9VIBR|nr:ATP-binding protein [Vibrio ostreicida]MDN3610558.1 ATP-binding protein [Vibrio ostreicida]NPD07442.1 sensor histidine kinase [Vibrio ostreicida]